jgi:hypothetical protein
MAEPDPRAWVGWYRREGPPRVSPWRAVCFGASESEAFRKLLEFRIPGEHCCGRLVLPRGVNPVGAKK